MRGASAAAVRSESAPQVEGAPGDAASSVRLTPVALARSAPTGTRRVTAEVSGGTATLDALLVMPAVARLTASGSTGSVVLLTSKSDRREVRTVSIGGRGRLQATSYDRNGVRTVDGLIGGRRAVIEPGGFTLVFRSR